MSATSRVSPTASWHRALFAALELDLFTRLAGRPKSVSVLAAEAGTSPNHLRTLLVALASVGLLTKRGDTFANAPAADTYLVRGAPRYYGDYLRVVNGKFTYRYLVNLDRTLRGERVAEG